MEADLALSSHSPLEKGGEDALRVSSRIGRVMTALRGVLSSGETSPHPDFRIEQRVRSGYSWFHNRDWGPLNPPEKKVGFFVSDLTQLNDCPWVCKITRNRNPDHPEYPYFCMVFGDPNRFDEDPPYGLRDMMVWALKFAHPALFNHETHSKIGDIVPGEE